MDSLRIVRRRRLWVTAGGGALALIYRLSIPSLPTSTHPLAMRRCGPIKFPRRAGEDGQLIAQPYPFDNVPRDLLLAAIVESRGARIGVPQQKLHIR